MKKLITTALCLVCAMALTVSAADGGKGKGGKGGKGKGGQKGQRPQLTDAQKNVMQELTKKYDKNGNGRIDGDERAAISDEDKKKMSALRGGGNRPQLTEAQKKVMAAMVKKYDKNGNKRLDRDEFGAMSQEDRKKMMAMRGGQRGKGKGGQKGGKSRPKK
jgi:hypothetical protein